VLRRITIATVLQASLLLVLAASALAETDNGEGLAGETTDRTVTFFSLGVLLFFPLVALLFTLVEHWLEKRKERRHAAGLHHGSHA
jgi:hypothetical protein